jgi:hypothetical protein
MLRGYVQDALSVVEVIVPAGAEGFRIAVMALNARGATLRLGLLLPRTRRPRPENGINEGEDPASLGRLVHPLLVAQGQPLAAFVFMPRLTHPANYPLVIPVKTGIHLAVQSQHGLLRERE